MVLFEREVIKMKSIVSRASFHGLLEQDSLFFPHS